MRNIKQLFLWVLACTFMLTLSGFTSVTQITLSIKNKPVKEVIKEIEKNSDYRFFYNDDLTGLNTVVSINVKNGKINQVMDIITSQAAIAYVLKENNQVVLAAKTEKQQQGKVISGVVTDDKGEPVIGANVVVKGTTNGTITDVDGNFSLTLLIQDNSLEISYIGYSTKEVPIGNNTYFTITLLEDSKALEEVVVIGYGTVKKKDLTGSVARVNAGVYQNQPKTQVMDMLAGTVAGFYATQSATASGGASKFEIRGPTSLKASNAPLIVLNGVIYNGDLVDINPNDVESIDILKDASSAAVYGARAAAGVVIINTKKGNKGKPVINFSVQMGAGQVSNSNFRPYDAEGFLKFRQDAMTVWFPKEDYKYFYYDPDHLPSGTTLQEWRNASANPAADNRDEWGTRLNLFPTEKENFLANRVTDFNDLVLQSALRQSYDVNIGGGSDGFSYYWSLGYDDNEDLVTGSRFSAVRTRFNTDYNVTDWLKVGVNAQYSDRDDSAVPVSLGHGAVSPYASAYDENSKVVWYPTGYQGLLSPLLNYEEQQKYRRVNNLLATLFAHVTLPLGFKYELTFQPRYEFIKDYNFWGTDTYTGSVSHSKGYGSRVDYSRYEWVIDNILRWNRYFGSHHFDVTLLYSAEQNKSWQSSMTGETFSPNTNLNWHALQQAEKVAVSNNDTELTGNAFMARLNYILMDKYLLTASIRQDGFSAFGQNNPTAVFPALALAWNISEENFFRVPLISLLKLRTSWGVNGNRDIGQYSALALVGSSLYYDGTSNLYNSSMANAGLRWERTEALNFGIDLGLWDNRVLLTMDYYDMTTTDLLMDRRLPILTGYYSVTTNLGELGNKGFDMTVNTMNFNEKDFSWKSNFVFSLNRNKIKKLFGDMGDYLLMGQEHHGELPDYTNKLFPGQALDQVWAYKITGVWQEEEREAAALYNLTPGSYKSEDLDDNKKYEDRMDKQFIGYTTPRFRLGLGNDFTFLKHFTASLFLRADLGHIARASLAERVGGYGYNRLNEYDFPYWTPENRNNEWCGLRPDTTPYGGGLEVYKSASFLRVQDFSLAYNLPESILSKAKCANMRAFFSIRNVYTLTDWIGWDPESLNYPMPRIYTIGLNVSL
jgi:TonB-linked SusC/RagA family outer membrane protein